MKAASTSIYLTSAAVGSGLLARLVVRAQQYGSVQYPQGRGEDGAQRQGWIDGADAVVAELSGPDATVGSEIFYALHKRRVATLCLVPRGTPALPMLEGNTHQIHNSAPRFV